MFRRRVQKAMPMTIRAVGSRYRVSRLVRGGAVGCSSFAIWVYDNPRCSAIDGPTLDDLAWRG
jgi:hypothetical protein